MNILIEDKLNIFHYKIARVLDKWREVGIIGQYYFFTAQLVLISEMQQFSVAFPQVFRTEPSLLRMNAGAIKRIPQINYGRIPRR